MAKFSPLMMAPPVIFLGLAGLFLFGMNRDNPNELPTALQGKPAPAITLEVLGNKDIFTDESLRDGKLKLVNFWASWCAPCRVEHPTLIDLQAEGIDVYGINYKDQPEKALKFLRDLGDPFTAVGADTNGKMALNWGVYGVPETYLVDGDGKILLRVAGPLTQRELTNRLRPAMEAAEE